MLRIELNNLDIEYFKGLRRFGLPLDGADAVVEGENKTKKTSTNDALHWLFFDKSADGRPSSGKGHFGLRPHYKNGRDIPNVTVMVEAKMSFDRDGVVESHTLKKEQREKIIRGKITGYPNQYYIDEAPVLKKDYDKFLDGYISEDVFRLLTDVNYFCGELHYLKRREFLVKLAGDPETPEGYEGLFKRANGRKLEDYKKALVFKRDGHGDREGYKKELEKIPTAIKENLRNLEQPDKDTAELTEQRNEFHKEIVGLKCMRKELLDTEGERQEKIGKVNLLMVERNKRVADMRNDPFRTAALQEERTKLLDGLRMSEDALRDEESDLKEKMAEKELAENTLNLHLLNLEGVRKAYKEANEKKESTVCYACGKKLPKDKIAEMQTSKQKKLDELTEQGNELFRKVEIEKKKIVDLEIALAEQSTLLNTMTAEVAERRESTEARIEQIANDISDLPEPDYAKDKAWLKYDKEIKGLRAEIGDPAGEQLAAIETKQTGLEEELEGVNKALAPADRMESDKARVAELEAREKVLAQLIADIDKEIDLIKQYNLAYSRLVEEAVNDRFQYVTFKLFDVQINGEIDDRVCDAMAEGTKWDDMSKGQSIKAGTDVINTLSEFYKVSVPLFIDEAESLSLPIKTRAQTIRLKMVEGVKQLQVHVRKKEKAKVA